MTTTDLPVSWGSSPLIRSAFSFASIRAMSIFVPHLKDPLTILIPSIDSDSIPARPLTDAIASSIFTVTSFSTSDGEAPSSVVITVSTGSSMSGKSSTGSFETDIIPKIQRAVKIMAVVILRLTKSLIINPHPLINRVKAICNNYITRGKTFNYSCFSFDFFSNNHAYSKNNAVFNNIYFASAIILF